jgi:hypothetical protein
MTTIINMTPHAVTILGQDNQIIKSIEASGKTIRLAVETVEIGQIEGIRLTSTKFGEPIGLPEFEEGTYYIVSQLIKSALPNRQDLLVPAEVVRDDKGLILGCKSFGI